MIINKIEDILGKLKIPNYVLLLVIVGIGFLIRISTTYWDISIQSPDAFLFLLEGKAFAEGNFERITIRALWPIFLSGFFFVFQFDETIHYMNLIRIVSISVSTVTIFLIYKISKEFFQVKYALIAASFFALDPSIIQNSILGIREPIFLLLGLIAFFYGIQKNDKYLIFAFIFAGLAFDARINGIAILIFLTIITILRFRNLKKAAYWSVLGTIIFLAVGFPHIVLAIEQEQIPYVNKIFHASEILEKGQITPSTFNESDNPNSENIILTSIIRELVHLARICLPITWIFAGIGLFLWFKNRDYKFFAITFSIIVILAIALPMYFQSAEYRNILLASPLIFILATYGIEKKIDKHKYEKIFLVVIVTTLFFSSILTLYALDDKNKIEIQEKEEIAQEIIQKFSGRFMGDLFPNLTHSIPNVKHGEVENTSTTLYYNDKNSITIQDKPITTIEFLMNESEKLQVDYIVIDSKKDNRYPIFEEIFENESEFSFLIKEFDSKENGFSYHVKLFKLDFEKFELLKKDQ